MFTSTEKTELTLQQSRVIGYLESGSTLTNSVAMNNLGVGSLTSRIAELRKLGFEFITRIDKGVVDGRAFKKYDLVKGTGPANGYTLKGE